MTVNCTFIHLKVCWHALSTHLKVEEENLLSLIVTTCILHNICETMGEVFHKAWTEEAWYTT